MGHSFGGPVCISFAARWPDELGGLVLVDPTHPKQFSFFGPFIPDAMAAMKEFWTQGWRSPESTPEGLDLPATFEDVEATRSLGDLPVMVVTAATWKQPGAPEELQSRWVEMHQDYVRLSSRGRQRLLDVADHFLQRAAPGEVAAAIIDLVEATSQ